MHLNKLQVDCVVISDDVLALFDSAYRLKIISNLRNVVRAQGDVLNNFSPMMQISQVEDFDISNVLGFVDPENNPLKKTGTEVSYSDSNYLIVVVSISLIITSVLLLVCVSFLRDVLEKREMRHYETQDTSAY